MKIIIPSSGEFELREKAGKRELRDIFDISPQSKHTAPLKIMSNGMRGERENRKDQLGKGDI